jgi:hypothetical protein
MTTPPASRLAGGAAMFLIVVAGLYAGLSPTVPPSKRTCQVNTFPDGGTLPPDALCIWTTGKSSAEARALFGCDSSGGEQYVQTRIYAPETDGGAVSDLPSGMVANPDTQYMEPCDGGPVFFAAMQGEEAFPCACSTGMDCEELAPDGGWVTARANMTHESGRWRGEGCFRKACAELSELNSSSWPAECPQ